MNVSISGRAEAALRAKAGAAGVDVEVYAARYLELMAVGRRSVREISGPIGEAFSRSGVSEEEVAAFLEVEKHEMRAGRRGKGFP